VDADRQPAWFVRWRPVLAGLGWIAGIILFYLAIKYVLPFVAPFVIAVVLAVLIDPTVNGLEERVHLPRGWAVALTLLFFLALLVGLLLFGVGTVVVQLGQLAKDLPDQYLKVVAWSESVLQWAAEVFRGLPSDFVEATSQTIRSSFQSISSGVQTLVKALIGGLAAIPSAFLVGVISLVATFFLSRDKDLIGQTLLRFLPGTYRSRVVEVNRDVVSSAIGLIKAQLTLVAMSLVILVVGLLLLGVRYAWLVGLVAGLLDVLPAVGPTAVLAPWAIYCLLDHNPGLGIGLLVLIAVVSVFRQVMEPRIVGQRLGIHPILTLLALFLGLKLLGPSGIVIGPLAAIIVKAIIRSGQSPPRPRPKTWRRRDAVAEEKPAGGTGS